MNSLYVEAGLYDKALKHLEENKAVILDKLVLEERRGKYLEVLRLFADQCPRKLCVLQVSFISS